MLLRSVIVCFFRRDGVPKTPSDRACLVVKVCFWPRYLRAGLRQGFMTVMGCRYICFAAWILMSMLITSPVKGTTDRLW